MLVCQAEKIARHYRAEPVFSDVSFQIYAGERIGLVGPNGAGKSTLLSLLIGDAKPDWGSIHFGTEVSVKLLRQIPDFPAGQSLIGQARRALDHLQSAYDQMVEAGEQIAAAKSDDDRKRWSRKYDDLQEFLRRHGGYEFNHRIEEVLFGLGFRPEDFDRPLESFSGGQRNRVLLAELLLSSPDIMLLDEPTNHLDMDTIEWLEAYLRRQTAAQIIVSHDRYFLDRTIEKVFELQFGTLNIYPGNFEQYRKLRDEKQKVLERTSTKQREQIAHYQDFVDRNRYGQLAKQAKSREKMIARVEADLVDRMRDVSGPRMSFGEPTRTGDIAVEVSNVGMEFPGNKLFSDFSLVVERGERLGLVGPNGAGKTTLLRIMLGELEPTNGTSRLGANVKVGYLDQNLAILDPEATPLDVVRPPWRITEKPEPFRALLAQFGIDAAKIDQRIGTLSGGERTRVALARLRAFEINLLALDEPTNHLDLWACEALEDALEDFDGTVLVVSHDRAFLSNVVNRLIYVADGTAKLIPGGYEKLAEYRMQLAAPKAPVAEPDDKKAKPSAEKRKRKFPYRKVDAIEADIASRESRIAELEQRIVEPDVYKDGRKVKEINDELGRLRGELSQLYEHWEEATELNG